MLDHDNLGTGIAVGRLFHTPVRVDLTSNLSVIGRVVQIR
jgi:hypothetical protein